MLRVLDSMSFHKFIEERGPPFRSCDIFDDVYAQIYEQLKREIDPITMINPATVFEHIKDLANLLLWNVSHPSRASPTDGTRRLLVGESIATANVHAEGPAAIANELYARQSAGVSASEQRSSQRCNQRGSEEAAEQQV